MPAPSVPTHHGKPTPPRIDADAAERGFTLALKGQWTLRGLSLTPDLSQRLAHYADDGENAWDLRELDALDSAGAFILWQAWGEKLPERLQMQAEHQRQLLRWAKRLTHDLPPPRRPAPLLYRLTALLQRFFSHLSTWTALLGQLVLDLAYLARHPQEIPWREISATIHETGGRALGITALVGFLIGVVVSYLSALQLQNLGAQIFIVNILGIGVIRELGPLLAAILVAGRSGSAMTARLGVMRVTQELDALAAMGISHSRRLVLPKVLALIIALPLLVVWTDIVGLLGGALAAKLELDISFHQFLLKLPSSVPVINFAIGLSKGAVFGVFIALVACHFGLRIKPDTESLGNETTNSVVASITMVILVDSVFAILFRSVGLR